MTSSSVLHANCVLEIIMCVKTTMVIFMSIEPPPFPQIDIIGALVIVWRVRGKIIESILCSIMCNNCAQRGLLTYEKT